MTKLSIKTTQNVPLYFTSASLGERMLGYALDMLIKAAYLVSVYYLLKSTGGWMLINGFDSWTRGAFFLFFYMPVAFYSLVCESWMEGQTFGKKIVKTKVVKIDGFQATFSDYVARWLFRLIDIDLGYVPGVLTMLFTKHTQRLGDIAAGTAVITLKSKYNISHTILAELGEDYVPTFSPTQILLFSDEDIRIIKENAQEAYINSDHTHLNILVERVESVIQMKNSFQNPHDFIARVIEDYNFYTSKG